MVHLLFIYSVYLLTWLPALNGVSYMPTIAAVRIQFLQSRISRFDDQLAYKELFTSFYPALLQFVSSIVKSRQSAEEIVSDLFLKIWEKRKTLEEIQNLRVYCFVAARHLGINQLEKQKRQKHANIEEYKSQLLYAAPDPEQSMISAEMLRRIHDVVEELPARCKMSFKLVKEYGFKYREAAEILQVSEKTIENQLSIALKKISAAIHFDICRSIPVIAGVH
jgi:RNA polymerase sigma-70 factor (family 1)